MARACWLIRGPRAVSGGRGARCSHRRGARPGPPRPRPASAGGRGLRPGRPCSRVVVCLTAGWGVGGHTSRPALRGTNVSVVHVMAVEPGKAGGFSEHLYDRKEPCAEAPVTDVRNGGGFWLLHPGRWRRLLLWENWDGDSSSGAGVRVRGSVLDRLRRKCPWDIDTEMSHGPWACEEGSCAGDTLGGGQPVSTEAAWVLTLCPGRSLCPGPRPIRGVGLQAGGPVTGVLLKRPS